MASYSGEIYKIIIKKKLITEKGDKANCQCFQYNKLQTIRQRIEVYGTPLYIHLQNSCTHEYVPEQVQN